MRFDKRISFVTVEDSYYDSELGEYVEGEPIKTVIPCHLSPMKLDRKKELFGGIDTLITVARLQSPYHKSFDYIEIDGKKMNLKHQSDYRKGVFYLEGVKSNES